MAAMNPVVTKKILDNMDTKEKVAAINGEGKSAQQIALDKLAQIGNGATVAAPSGAVTQPNTAGTTESDAVSSSWNKLNSLQKPTQGTSTWMDSLNGVIDQIMNGEKFSYDLNGDALYQQYKNQYMTQGQQAMMDTMGQAAALTGGYGNSYAQSVGQQTYQGYLQQLNDKVPELYQLALDQYNRGREELYNQYALLSDREQTDYDRYRDTVSDYYTDYGNYYTEYRDAVGDQQWQEQFDYQKDRDAVSDQQWQTEFDEGVRQFDTNVALTKEEMAIQQQQWQAEYDLKVKEADRNYELTVRQIEEDVRHNKITEEQAQQQIALAKEELAQEKELAEKELAYKYAELASEERQTNAKIQAEKAATVKVDNTAKKKVEEDDEPVAAGDYSDWTGEDWANYFDQIRMYEYDSKTGKYVPRTNLKEGEAEALAELKELTSKGLIPKNYVSVASSAARGGKMGH